MINQAEIEESVRRVVRVAQPDRIILFGSLARGEAREDSDIDLLVIKSGLFNKRQLAGSIYRALVGIRVPVDIVIVTPEEAEHYRGKIGTVIQPALEEGKSIYEHEEKPH
ncbi:MAG: nucleotidyltransferase domain-containing protein [Bacteroidota bacterium]